MKFLNRFPRLQQLATVLSLIGLLFVPGDRIFFGAEVASAQSTNPCQVPGSGGPGPTYAGVNCAYMQNGIPSYVKTYRLAVYNQAWASQSGDLVYIQGSATKTVRVLKVIVSGQATAAVFAGITVQRHSATDTSGTCTAQTGTALGSLDTNNTTPTAGINLCTAAATPGASAGTIDACRLDVGAVGTPTTPDVCVFTYGVNDDQMLTLRGTGDWIGVNTGSFGAGGVVDVVVELAEEP